ncbi:MAG: sterol desaturase family protein [Pseudomonadaceae bacterium]|nr:sterol desaturase family protein [Pseudomonadaceae bacterium]
MSLTALFIPIFVIAMLIEYAWGMRRGRNTYDFADTVASVQVGSLRRLRGLAPMGYVTILSLWLAAPFDPQTLPRDEIWVWLSAIVLWDFFNYWSHRLSHGWKLLWATHVSHHSSEHFNLAVALRQNAMPLVNFLFFVPLFMLGYPLDVIAAAVAVNAIYQTMVHTEHVGKLWAPIEYVMVTPSNHRVHHARNPNYIDKNFGTLFIIWDRLFGTYAEEREEEACEFGITTPVESYNPVWINMHLWWQYANEMLRTPRWRDKFTMWFQAPAQATPGVSPIDIPMPAPRKKHPMSKAVYLYTGIQFVVSFIVAGILIWNIKTLGLSVVAPFALLIIGSSFVQGAWLDSRNRAWIADISFCAAGLLIVFALIAPRVPAAVTAATLGYLLTCSVVAYALHRYLPIRHAHWDELHELETTGISSRGTSAKPYHPV